MPNPWTGKGNPYTRTEVIARLRDTMSKGKPIIAAGAGTGISAKFIERGGADLVIVYNSGRFRMAGHGSTAGMMAYGDANQVAMDIGEYEVLPVVEEIPVICGVHATDPRRRMWHWLGKVKDMGFSGINNFPSPPRSSTASSARSLEETGMSVKKEFETVALARKMDMFTIVYVGSPEESKAMAEAGADVIIAHVGTDRRRLHRRHQRHDEPPRGRQDHPRHHRRREVRPQGPHLPQPRRADRHPRGRRLHQRAHRHGRLRRRLEPRTHGRRAIAHRPDQALQADPGEA
jgi:hypothetical protein